MQCYWDRPVNNMCKKYIFVAPPPQLLLFEKKSVEQ